MDYSTKKDNGTAFQLGLFFELSKDFLCIAGFDGYFKKVNPAFIKVLGYPLEVLLERPINNFIHKKDRMRTDHHRNRLRSNNALLNFENRYVAQNGDIIWLSWTSMPFPKEQLVYAIAKDITHKKELEAKRNLLLANITKTNQELTQLTYRTSHDLRSPVNNLVTLMSLVDTTKIQDPQTLELLQLVHLATQGLKHTLDDFVENLGDNHILHAPAEELRLRDIIFSVKASIGSLVEKSGAIFKVDFSEIGTIHFNRTYLESIFLNLITNSIKYSKPDEDPYIFIRSKKLENGIQLIFRDQGLGFDMDKVKDRIFRLNQKFHHHKDSTGIGLYLVHNHITNAGGSIQLESKLNEGAQFTITLPT